jgi:hypothetical protein
VKKLSKFIIDSYGNRVNTATGEIENTLNLLVWKEREPLPRASHKKTSLKEFSFSWKKRAKWYK